MSDTSAPTTIPPISERLTNADDHWQTRLSGHGITYFRELIVEYKTLQWANPYAAATAVARESAKKKRKIVIRAGEALSKSANSQDRALKALLDEAQSAGFLAEKAAVLAESKMVAAENA